MYESEEKARLLEICPACGVQKDIGLVVCWSCFKYIAKPLKYTDKLFLAWLDTHSFTPPDAPTIAARNACR